MNYAIGRILLLLAGFFPVASGGTVSTLMLDSQVTCNNGLEISYLNVQCEDFCTFGQNASMHGQRKSCSDRLERDVETIESRRLS